MAHDIVGACTNKMLMHRLFARLAVAAAAASDALVISSVAVHRRRRRVQGELKDYRWRMPPFCHSSHFSAATAMSFYRCLEMEISSEQQQRIPCLPRTYYYE